MRRLFFVSLVILGFTATSCKKCSTCTSTTPAADGTDSTITSEFCEKGRVYTNELYQYERAGWSCAED